MTANFQGIVINKCTACMVYSKIVEVVDVSWSLLDRYGVAIGKMIDSFKRLILLRFQSLITWLLLCLHWDIRLRSKGTKDRLQVG